jgi:hypothetical protein
MNRSVITLGSLFTAGALGAGALLVTACAGHVQSGGELANPQTQAVSVADVSGPVVACGDGYAHPNVCCVAGPSTTTACSVCTDVPFHACGGGTVTYPDPRSCCPLDGNGNCVAPPPSSPPIQPSPPDGCGYACPVGQYEPQGQAGTCCGNDPSGASFCSGFTVGAPTGCGCACPACPVGDACPPCDCNCPPPPPPPQCGSCPPGWQAPEGAPYLCCAEQSGGVIECFSQAAPPTPTPVYVDAGAPVSVTGGGASSSNP